MIKTIIIILFSAFIAFSIQAQPPLEQVEKHLQEKIKEATSLLYKGEFESWGKVFAENAIIPQMGLSGKDQIIKAFSVMDFPQTEYTIEFEPITQIDSIYILNYRIIETSGFVPNQTEVWKFVGGEWKIVALYFVLIEPKGESGISKQRFILSSLLIGVFLFLLLIIIKNAWSWKSK